MSEARGAVKLTKASVDKLAPEAAAYIRYDAALAGFGVRVNPTGRKSWVIEYRVGGGGRRATATKFTLGRVGEMTADEARRRASALLVKVRDGFNPAGELKDRRAAPTLSELADRWLSEQVRPKRKARTAAEYAGLLKRYLPAELGNRKAADIRRADIAKLHHSLSGTPYGANRMLATLSSLFSWAIKVGQVPEGSNPASRIDRYREQKRDRFLSSDELERLGETLRRAETPGEGLPWQVNEGGQHARHLPKASSRFTVYSPFVTATIRLLLLTGCRRSEILGLRWSEVDFERRRLRLSDSKTGRKDVVLSAPALAVLAELPKLGAYVIAGQDANRQRVDIDKAWEAIRRHAGIPDVRLHDLRHTYAAEGAGGGLSLPLIGRLLGHTQPATTQRYAHLADDPLRVAAESVGASIAARLAGSPSAVVVPIKGTAA